MASLCERPGWQLDRAKQDVNDDRSDAFAELRTEAEKVVPTAIAIALIEVKIDLIVKATPTENLFRLRRSTGVPPKIYSSHSSGRAYA